MKKKANLTNVKNLTLLSLMTALVIVFQTIGLIVPIGFNVAAFALVPMVIGAAMLGPLSGAWLGFIFGIIIIATGGAAAFYPMGVITTVLVVLIKGALAGWLSGIIYKMIEKKNSLLAIILSSIICPLVNTAVFTLACFTVFFPGISGWAQGAGKDMISYVFLTLIGANFFVELTICTVFASVAKRVIDIGKKMHHNKNYI